MDELSGMSLIISCGQCGQTYSHGDLHRCTAPPALSTAECLSLAIGRLDNNLSRLMQERERLRREFGTDDLVSLESKWRVHRGRLKESWEDIKTQPDLPFER